MSAISQPLLRTFFDGLGQEVQIARRLRQRTNRFLAEDFSTFSYIDVVEPKLSAITADLLKPNGSHGQGEVFVRAFLRILGIERGAPIEVSVEAQTRFILSSQRRIDIKLRWSDFVLAVENKPWAIDQADQIEDYVNHLEKESQGRFLCIYLSGDGSAPDESSISSDRLSELKRSGQIEVGSYPKLMCRWLSDCIDVCQADRVRWFLRDFRQYLVRQFPDANVEEGNVNISDDPVVAYALQNKQNLQLAYAVGARFSSIKASVIGAFARALGNELIRQSKDSVVVFRNTLGDNPLGPYSGLYFGKPAWRGKFSIGIESAAKNACRIYFGVKRERERPGAILFRLAAKLDGAFGHGEVTESLVWDWFQFLNVPYQDWDSEQVLSSLYELEQGAALSYLSTLLLRAFEIASEDIDVAVGKTSEELV